MRWLYLQAHHRLLRQQGHLFPWVPVCIGAGVGLYFTLLEEPAVWLLWVCFGAGLAGMVLRHWLPFVPAVALCALSCGALGMAAAGARAHWMAAPVLDFRYYGAVEGRVVWIDRSASDALRVTLDRVVMERMAPLDTPKRVRVSLHGVQVLKRITPGDHLIVTAHLSPPGGAVEPGGFDFRRHAWFLQLGALGYARAPALRIGPPDRTLYVARARMWMSERVLGALPGARGAFAAAVTSGDRSALDQATLGHLRDTNLAHLLAISGLHMGLLAGFVFTALRLGLILLPATRHSLRAKPLAAGGALIAAAGYLALSGGNVATERAFTMVAVALCAVMVHRRAISLRGVALAAVIILLWQPEALVSPGFQMSFAATVALVAVFERVGQYRTKRSRRWVMAVFTLVLSSGVAGLATAPVAMAHFNRFAHFGLIANVISVPVMGLWVVPMAVFSAVLMPFGLDWIGWHLMGFGLEWILTVAAHVAAWEGAVGHVPAPPGPVLALYAVGGLTLCLWRGWGRLVGLLPLCGAAVLWAGTQRPDVLISENGALVGLRTEQGRALSRASGSGFIAQVWLENDGGGLEQADAAALWPRGSGPIASGQVAGYEVISYQGKTGLAGFTGCSPHQIVVSNQAITGRYACDVFDQNRLKTTGSVALSVTEEGLKTVTAAAKSGDRLWTQGQ